MPSPPPLVRYVLVGGLGTSVNYASFALLVAVLAYPAASAIGYVLGTLAAYTLNRRWTFGIAEHRSSYLARYITVQVAGMAATVGLLAALVELGGLAPLVAQGLALATVTLTTFQVNRRWSFAAGG